MGGIRNWKLFAFIWIRSGLKNKDELLIMIQWFLTNSFKALLHCTILWPVSAACQQNLESYFVNKNKLIWFNGIWQTWFHGIFLQTAKKFKFSNRFLKRYFMTFQSKVTAVKKSGFSANGNKVSQQMSEANFLLNSGKKFWSCK